MVYEQFQLCPTKFLFNKYKVLNIYIYKIQMVYADTSISTPYVRCNAKPKETKEKQRTINYRTESLRKTKHQIILFNISHYQL